MLARLAWKSPSWTGLSYFDQTREPSGADRQVTVRYNHRVSSKKPDSSGTPMSKESAESARAMAIKVQPGCEVESPFHITQTGLCLINPHLRRNPAGLNCRNGG